MSANDFGISKAKLQGIFETIDCGESQSCDQPSRSILSALHHALVKADNLRTSANDSYQSTPPLPDDDTAFVPLDLTAAHIAVSKPTLQRWRRQGRIKAPIYLSTTKAVYEAGYIRELKAKMKAGEF